MEKRKWECARAFPESLSGPAIFSFLFSFFAFFLMMGCGAPGEPTPPRHAVPQAVSDLSARQQGDGVFLNFTLPSKALDGTALQGPPSVEIYRRESPAPGTVPGKIPQLVHSIPSAMVETYLTQGRVEFRDALPPEDVSNSAGLPIVYTVRTRATPKRPSPESNAASLRVYPPPQPPSDLQAKATKTAIELSWTPPTATTAGGPFVPSGFRVYRAVLVPGQETAVLADISKAKLQTPLALLAPAAEPSFRDAQFEFGQTYLYIVRSVAQEDSSQVESADSQPVVVTPRDVFPPAAPNNPVAIVVPAVAGAPAYIELSWAISPETDLAGYNVYRAEGLESAGRGERLNADLLLTPSFRDMTARPGHSYAYRITAVDRVGNESQPSLAVTAELPPQQR